MHLELMRDPAKVLPEQASPERIRSAKVWHCRYKTLRPLSQFQNLKTLVVATYPDDTFSILSRLRDLTYLSILHLPNISDLSPLGSLEALETLSLATLPSWDASGRVQVVRSLQPLAVLPKLRHLELLGVRSDDGSLECLGQANLSSARFSKFKRTEIERFFQLSGAADRWNPKPAFDAA